VHRCGENICERFRTGANVRGRGRCFSLLRTASIRFSSLLRAGQHRLGGSVRVVWYLSRYRAACRDLTAPCRTLLWSAVHDRSVAPDAVRVGT
jgi:hypothetical protein